MVVKCDNVKVPVLIFAARKFFRRSVGCLVITLILMGCNSQRKSTGLLPPGMAYLRQAPAGKDYEAFFEEATVESERFRRRLLSGKDPDFISADLLAKAIMAFRRQAPDYLKGHKDESY